MSWFGLDIGGTLTKLVYFEPLNTEQFYITQNDINKNKIIRKYLITNKAYGKTGIRDIHLQLDNIKIHGKIGTIHFIRFPTSRMTNFINLVKSKGFANKTSIVCATGGGASKYENIIENELQFEFHKTDELESLIKGIEFLAGNYDKECFYYENLLDVGKLKKIGVKFNSESDISIICDSENKKEELQYPYVVVNIGSGVSILVVKGQNNFSRVSGSSIGGGFFQGLCCLLCNCDTFEESIQLAAEGSNKTVDKFVSEFYGSNYESTSFNEDTVAASFGKIFSNNKNISKADLARAALVTTTSNIGSIALSVANQYKINRIVFVGNFLRINDIAARLLSSAINFCSQGKSKAIFLKHEGYFGAVGCLDKLVDVLGMKLLKFNMGIKKILTYPLCSINYKWINFIILKFDNHIKDKISCGNDLLRKGAKCIGWFCYILAIFLISLEIFIIYSVILPFELLYKSFWQIYFVIPLSIYLIIQIFFNYNCAVFIKPGTPKKIDSDPKCKRCFGYKPYGTHHCSFCNNCILLMDHHCIWINQCVGARNHRFFFQFLAFLWIGTFVVMIYAFNTFWKHIIPSYDSEIFCHRSDALDYLPWFATFCSNNYRIYVTNMAVFGYLLPTVIFFAVGFLVVWNFILISNRTTQANFVQEKYFDLQTIKELIYDGIYHNKMFRDVWNKFLGLENGRTFWRHILMPSFHIPIYAKLDYDEFNNDTSRLIHII
uniref:Palmitoyltransferase n=1 Tax=Parastrongyloides trichosuri TaxID=131310 RepID=A0A0N4ZCN9_PARTI